ncbi:MAG: helix-turn-helix transcriptional regulator [Halodesulfurarchaeum sp.]
MNRLEIGWLLLIMTLIGGVVVAPAAGTSLSQVGELDSDLVIIGASVEETGTATLEIEYAIRLSDENETTAFEQLQADIEENESLYLDRFEDRMNRTVQAAENSTGRSMSVSSFEVETNRETTFGEEYGFVTYRATWSEFAAVEDEQILAGDSLEGIYLDQQTRLEMYSPEGYEATSVSPDAGSSNGGISWSGPLQFDDSEPSVVFEPVAPTEATTSPSGETQTPTTAPSEPGESSPPWILYGGGGLVIAAIVGWIIYRRRFGEGADTVQPGDGGAGQPPSELLSNEERVEAYLESVGGRAKQQEMVDALGWTEAKTSQVLSEMAEEETIEKFRIGRENVVKLAENGSESE